MSSVSLSLIELLIKGIPEGLLDVLAVFILSRVPFDKKKYFLITGLFITITYLIRLLPINYGVNTMLGLLVLVILFIIFVKVDMAKLIKSAITILITLFACEEINLLLLFAIFGKEKTAELINDTFTKALAGIPSTILFALAIFCMYLFVKKKDQKKQLS